MVTIKPFAALRPKPELASRICELPYDVMSSDEARQMASGNPLSFLHVSKPEIDLSPETDHYAPEVYAKGLENFTRLRDQGALVRDPLPCFYLYRQVMGQHSQVGFVAAASCEDYLQQRIRRHEFTRVDKEDDRVRHIETLNAQTGPAFLIYRGVKSLDDWMMTETSKTPSIDFTATDGIRHTAWVVSDEKTIRWIEAEFARMDCLYIADGHHRTAAAGRVFQSRKGAGGSDCFLSVIFSHRQLRILPYNRMLKDMNGLSTEDLFKKLEAVVTVSPPGIANPVESHQMGFYIAGKWHTLRFKTELLSSPNPVERLDVALLQNHILAPIFGIDDPRTSSRIQFVGGIRGVAELEKEVNSGKFACAFSMFPTQVEELMTIADAGGIMPPKSTWFEPKLRDAMFCHLI